MGGRGEEREGGAKGKLKEGRRGKGGERGKARGRIVLWGLLRRRLSFVV